MTYFFHTVCSIFLLIMLPGCWQEETISHRACIISEYFMTDTNQASNVDSVAVWHGEGDQHWVIATAKNSHTLPVYDAAMGKLIKTIGEPGSGANQLQRPNGIAVQDNLLFVIERDNKRLQIFSLPDGKSIGTSNNAMNKPYGIAVITTNPHKQYTIYVTDNGETHKGEPKKIHQFEAIYNNNETTLRLIRTFGDTTGNGALYKVESIAADPTYNRLFIADESSQQKNIKIYTLDGIFTGQTIGDGLILYEPEGIAIYEVNDQDGYIVLTDQDRQENTFWIFDRRTLQPIRSFIGNKTRNTDGIAITNKGFGPFVSGAFYAVHDDGSIHAYDWHTLAMACHLEERRP